MLLLLAWLLVAPRTPDLAAAAYRVDLFKHTGFSVYDEHWYAGHDVPGYSVLFPPLAWLLGLRAVGALSVLASVACFEALTRLAFGDDSTRSTRSLRLASVAFAAAAVGDVWIGRLAFALGVSFALGAALAFARGELRGAAGVAPAGSARTLAAAVLAAASAAASPVAGALLALAAVTHALWRRSPRALLVLTAPAVLVVLALAGLFPEGGSEPYPTLSFVATMLIVATFAWALPAGAGEPLLAAGVYALVCVAFVLVRTPVGSNVERYGVLLAGPLLVCALGRYGAADGWSGAGRALRRGGRVAAAVALAAWVAWAGWGPLRETLAVAGNSSTHARYYAPVERFLDGVAAGGPVRLEVPLTRTHWETAELAPRVSLARGWEKQLDTRYDAALLSDGLSPASYERWLHEQAVSYVALPDTKLDPSSAREGALIRAGLPYLRLAFASRHWRIYAVRDATPIASGPGRLVSLGHESFALASRSVGSFVVRVRWTRYWTVTGGAACVARAPGGWTRVRALRAGNVRVSASFSLSRALGSGGSCRE